jgi:hypothetical protein
MCSLVYSLLIEFDYIPDQQSEEAEEYKQGNHGIDLDTVYRFCILFDEFEHGLFIYGF